MVTPCFSARGRSVSVASSARRDRSTRSRVKDRWSARLSRSSASVRSIARVLTTWSRSTSSPVSRSGSLRATSRSDCVIASGVRSSWEALAANLRCSATCASSRASMVSKASASSRNSSLRPGSRIRWESDPFVAMRVASVMRVSGASIRPARIHPPTRPNTSRNASTMAAAGTKTTADDPGAGGRRRQVLESAESESTFGCASVRLGCAAQEEHPHGGEQQDAGEHEEPGVAEGELEADAQTRRPIHRPLPDRVVCSLDSSARCRCGSRRRARWR